MGADRPASAPECFARLERVFPAGADGLRHSPPECLQCPAKTDCLRTALAGGPGVDVHAEKLDRAYQAGQVGFLERWARRKSLEKRREDGAARVSLWRRWLRKLS
ncbi:MAG: hypothetical protein MUC33_06530 [Desulfobacterales bacterium]|jgi:hypothetical protein|nr:hypothetical protein [Desulfobacterales bacterium]